MERSHLPETCSGAPRVLGWDGMESTGRAPQPNSLQAVGRRFTTSVFAASLALCCVNCASPGPPRAPSLQLPNPVSDLSAARVGDHVEIRFTVPRETTDHIPVPSPPPEAPRPK